MKKLTFAILALAAFSAMAGVVPSPNFYQFTQSESSDSVGYYYSYIERDGDVQKNAPIIKMHVPANATVYLTHIVDEWINSGSGYWVADLGTVYDMSNYGYYRVSDLEARAEQLGKDALALEKEEYKDLFQEAKGEDGVITYSIDNSKIADENGLEVKTKGYILDEFDTATDIYLALTPLDETELTDSYQFADEPGVHQETILESRAYNVEDKVFAEGELDKAGNIRVNFGIHTLDNREFAAVYALPDDNNINGNGQPLPGLLLAGLLSLGTVAAGKKMRKRA